jgi:hypothetical protein
MCRGKDIGRRSQENQDKERGLRSELLYPHLDCDFQLPDLVYQVSSKHLDIQWISKGGPGAASAATPESSSRPAPQALNLGA